MSQYKEQFWSNLERAYANYDNAHFDIARQRERDRRKDRRDTILLATGMFGALLIIVSVYCIWLFGLMPLPNLL